MIVCVAVCGVVCVVFLLRCGGVCCLCGFSAWLCVLCVGVWLCVVMVDSKTCLNLKLFNYVSDKMRQIHIDIKTVILLLLNHPA